MKFYLVLTLITFIGAPLLINRVEANLEVMEERIESRYNQFPQTINPKSND